MALCGKKDVEQIQENSGLTWLRRNCRRETVKCIRCKTARRKPEFVPLITGHLSPKVMEAKEGEKR